MAAVLVVAAAAALAAGNGTIWQEFTVREPGDQLLRGSRRESAFLMMFLLLVKLLFPAFFALASEGKRRLIALPPAAPLRMHQKQKSDTPALTKHWRNTHISFHFHSPTSPLSLESSAPVYSPLVLSANSRFPYASSEALLIKLLETMSRLNRIHYLLKRLEKKRFERVHSVILSPIRFRVAIWCCPPLPRAVFKLRIIDREARR